MSAAAPAPALKRHTDEWEELADRDEEGSPWLRPGWILAWWRAFGRGRLDLATLRRDGRLAALVPVARTPGVVRSTANYHTPSFGLLAEDASAARELAADLFSSRPRRIELGFLTPESVEVSDLHGEAMRAGYRSLQRTLERPPYVATNGSWEEYEASLDGKLRRELRRRRRKLEAEARLEVAIEDGSTRLDEFLDEGFRIEAAAWKGEKRTAIASSPETESFYRAVARWAADRGWLRLAFLRLDGRPLAFDFAIEEKRRHHLLKTGYDPAFRRLAPAMILRHAMIARAFRLGLCSYEFGGRDELWKLEWTSRTRESVLFQAFARTPAGFAEWSAYAYARPVAQRVRALARR